MIKALEQFVRKNWYVVGFVSILLIAAFLRTYKLGEVPHGMTWDEAAIGYNGHAVLTTRRDEWLTRLPISFRSFGDYKAPFAIYLNGFFTVLFGMNLWAVRLPFALSGIMAVFGAILLGRSLFEESKYRSALALIFGLSLAVSPWHIHFTRTGFESGLALTMVIWGVYLFLTAWKKTNRTVVLLSLSVALFILSLYTYHSTKITVPLLGFYLVWQHRKTFFSDITRLVVPSVISAVMLIPLVFDLLFRNGLERAGVTVFAQGYGFFTSVWVTLQQFFLHLHPDFLLFGETTTQRHGDGVHGVLYPTTYALVLGVVSWILWNLLKKNTLPKYVFQVVSLASACIVFGILPAAVATEVPHSNRALTAIIGFLLFSTLGIAELLRFAGNHAVVKKLRDSRNRKTIFFQLIVGTFILLHALFTIEYSSYYFKNFARNSADDFKDGYIDAFNYVIPYETGKDGKHEVQNIIFTSKYGQPYIYALFARKTSPIFYHGGSLIKYLFQDSFVEGDLLRENTILVTSPEDIMPFEKASYVVYGSDRQPRFYIFDSTKIKW